jgi:pimeloyl-ACP methyl ester carboxylesterase
VDASPPPGLRREAEPPESRAGGESPIGFALLRQGWFRAIARYLDPKLLIEQGLRSAYNDSPVVDGELVERYYQLIMREGTRASILERSSGARPVREEVDLGVLTQPTLVMWGAQDALIPVSVVQEFEQVLPDVASVVYEDLGHIPMEEDPARSAADVMRFLEGLSDRSGD